MAKQKFDPGIGTRFKQRTKRIINKDGSFNVEKRGARFRLNDAYLIFINMSWGGFLSLLFLGYLIMNALFALVYMSLGVEALSHVHAPADATEQFLDAFYFSTQTFTTVGFGAIAPISQAASFVASVEAFVGFLSFSLATGLLFGRFSKPTARIRFSKNALIQTVNGERSLVFRIVNERPNQMMELSATVILNMTQMKDGASTRRYETLQLQMDRIEFFPLNWTIVHPIDENSPLHGMDDQMLTQSDGELLIHIKGFDEMFAQVIHRRFSYQLNEVVPNARFKPIFETNEEGEIVLDIDALDDYEEQD